jgi:pantetheine-phosphate adenylyltransferase
MPGSYDPVTLGHLQMIRQVAAREDEVFVVCFINPEKEYAFPITDRVAMLMLATEDMDNVLVSYSDGRVVDYVRDHGIEKIVKGYRDGRDLEWERYQAEYNMHHGGYETELIKCSPDMEGVSSTAVRAALAEGRVPRELLPPPVSDYIEEMISKSHRKDQIK